MKYLLLNTASKNNEVLLVNNNSVHYEKCGEKLQATENLLPCIDKMLDSSDLSLDEIDVFACVSGPGSFTGIRVGITTVRAFAYACNKPCVTMDYFDVLKQNSDAETVIIIVDAGNKMKYFTVRDKDNNSLLEPKYTDEETLRKFLSEIDEPYNIVSDVEIDGYNVLSRPEDGSDLLKAANLFLKPENYKNYSLVTPMYIAKSQAERDKGL